jgi:cytochrome oxidase Cu insertion factor (SCO1/SenC/PrrC family)
MNPEQANLKKNRLTLLLLLLVFLLPALGSWLLYANRANVHLGTTNKGEFVQPPRQLEVTALDLPTDWFAHHLTLVYAGGESCDDACRQALHVMRGTRLALGEQTDQVQLLYLSTGIPVADVTQANPGFTGRDVTSAVLRAGFDGADASKYIYLVDPNGYVVLRYPLAQDPKDILVDLRHLLGASEG